MVELLAYCLVALLWTMQKLLRCSVATTRCSNEDLDDEFEKGPLTSRLKYVHKASEDIIFQMENQDIIQVMES